MSLVNVVDFRDRSRTTTGLYVVVEPAMTDNDFGQTQYPDVSNHADFFEWFGREYQDADLSKVITDCASAPFPVTIYVYNDDASE